VTSTGVGSIALLGSSFSLSFIRSKMLGDFWVTSDLERFLTLRARAKSEETQNLWVSTAHFSSHACSSGVSEVSSAGQPSNRFSVFCLTSKMSHGGKRRGSCASRNRDVYRSWLHRVVRLTFLTEFHSLENARGFLGNACSSWVSDASCACEV
jgi:hypothetical protein